MKDNSIIVCAPTKLLGTMSFIVEPLIHWSKANSVELIASSKMDPPLDTHENITVRYFRDRELPSIFTVIPTLIELMLSIRRMKPSVVVGTNEAGILAVALASFFYRQCIYLCLHDEIRTVQDRGKGLADRSYGSMMVILVKAAVRRFHIHCSQDRWRCKITSHVYNVDESRFINLPNTDASSVYQQDAFFLYDLLNIDRRKKILLWIGRLKPATFLQSLVKSLDLLNDDYILVLHARDDSFLDEVRRVLGAVEENEKIRLSTVSVAYPDINRLLQSAYIGFCAFETENVNSRWIGHSSGKLNRFLQVGVPCIVTKQSGLKWVEKHGLGVSAESESEIANAVMTLGSSRRFYSENALQYSVENLGIEGPLRSLDQAIEHQLLMG